MISIITPVHNCSELIAEYEAAVKGAEVVIVDNASETQHAAQWKRLAERLGGKYIRNEENRYYAAACNQGYAAATGDLVVFCDNDVRARGDWLSILQRTVSAGAIYGPRRDLRILAGQPIVFLDGYFLAAMRSTWDLLFIPMLSPGKSEPDWFGPFDQEAFQAMYWMDVEICFRATRAGFPLRVVDVPLEHLSNYTSKRTKGAYAHTDSNGGDGLHKRIVEDRVKAARRAG